MPARRHRRHAVVDAKGWRAVIQEGRRWIGKLTTDTVFRNSMILIAARIGTKIATSVLLIYVARMLGDVLFGTFSE